MPVTHANESLRHFIIRTSDLPVIGALYREFYRAAIRALVRELASLDHTVSVLSRNSYAACSYVPGKSDIDVLVVTRDDLTAEETRLYLGRTYSRCERLRRRFPMLDHFPVYTHQGFIEACRLGTLMLETYAWRCEWGDAGLLSYTRSWKNELSLDTPGRCVQIYWNGFRDNLRMALRGGFTRPTLAMWRSARKLENMVDPGRRGIQTNAMLTMSQLVVHLIRTTTELALRADPEEPHAHSWRVLTAPSQTVEVVTNPRPLADGVSGVIRPRVSGTVVYIVFEPITAATVDHVLETMRRAAHDDFAIASEPLYAFQLRHVNPMLYYQLKAGRNVRGRDALMHIRAPSRPGLLRFFRTEATRLLQLSSRFGDPKTQISVDQYRCRCARLLHFVGSRELLCDPMSSHLIDSYTRSCADIPETVVQHTPLILNALRNNPDALSISGSATLYSTT